LPLSDPALKGVEPYFVAWTSLYLPLPHPLSLSHPHVVRVVLLLLASLLQAIKKHPDSEGLCTHAFNLLYLLSSDPVHVGRLVSNDLLDALSTTLEGRSCATP